MSRKEFKLLPHTKEKIYGLSRNSLQFFPWSIKTFDIEKAWKFSEGEDIVVGVIDTGCDTNHEDIKDNLMPGFNFIDNSPSVYDGNGHGTHVAGTVAALNNSIGMVGISPRTKILPVKALDDNGYGQNSHITNAIMWAVDHGADILTMSLGSPHPSRNVEKAIEYAVRNNVLVFCAAGNSGNNSDIQYPAKFDTTISIGAINHNLEICDFSCCGNELDFLAPGEDIVSATPGNNYTKMSGTSMATPFAVGCAALFLSLKKQKSGEIKNLKNKQYLINEFKENAMPLKGKYSGDKRYEGYGIIRPKV